MINEPIRASTGLTPREIVRALDAYIVGQDEAKRSVAIAMRNRWRRQQLHEDIRGDVLPKNILMLGPTGVGKTEIARRLSDLVAAPFVKVEASKYTEVGYVGRDVEGIIRELMETGVRIVREEQHRSVGTAAATHAEDLILDALLPGLSARSEPEPAPYRADEIEAAFRGEEPTESAEPEPSEPVPSEPSGPEPVAARASTRERLRERLRAGDLDAREIEIAVVDKSGSGASVFSNQGFEQMGIDMQSFMERMHPAQERRKKVTVADARNVLVEQETDRLIDEDAVVRDARERVETMGIVFIDEIDKITMAGEGGGSGPAVSREGVQRDLLPIVEGSMVPTRYGPVNTDHVLFVAAGAFHVAKVSDLIPELQGRFPIRVELDSLGEEDFVRILHEPRNALTAQYTALLETEGVHLEWTDEAIREVARLAARLNAQTQNIGARRLHSVMEKLLEKVSFEAPEMSGVTLQVDEAFVREMLRDVLEADDLAKFIL